VGTLQQGKPSSLALGCGSLDELLNTWLIFAESEIFVTAKSTVLRMHLRKTHARVKKVKIQYKTYAKEYECAGNWGK
jgi:hypothetical protein